MPFLLITVDDPNDRPLSPIETLDQQIDDLDSHISQLYFNGCWDEFNNVDDISLHGLGGSSPTAYFEKEKEPDSVTEVKSFKNASSWAKTKNLLRFISSVRPSENKK